MLIFHDSQPIDLLKKLLIFVTHIDLFEKVLIFLWLKKVEIWLVATDVLDNKIWATQLSAHLSWLRGGTNLAVK